MAHDEQAAFIPLYLHTNTGDSKDMETNQNWPVNLEMAMFNLNRLIL